MPNERRYALLASDEPEPMGETLLKYARPLFARLPQDHTFAELKAMIVFAALVWNIGFLDEVPDAVAYLARKMPPRLRLRPPQGLALIRRMLTRKELSFRDDRRVALDVQVERNGPKFHVRALGVDTNEQPNPALQDCDLSRRNLH